jgi:hypothetical protein
MRHILICGLALLSACVLHAKVPLFAEADATLLLGGDRIALAVFERKDGAWVASDEPVVTAIPEGNHYLVPDPATPDDLQSADAFAFIALDASHYAVQAMTGGEADYAIATWDGSELLVQPLDCDDLKAGGKAEAVVAFEDDACSLRPGTTPPREAFLRLLQAAPEPTLRLVKQ